MKIFPAVSWHPRPRQLWLVFAALLALLLMGVVASMEGYALREAIDHLAHRPFDAVAERDGGVFSPAALVFHAQRQTGGQAVRLELPARYDRAVRVMVVMPYGETVVAYMDPYTADLRGTVRYTGVVAMFDRWLAAEPDVKAGGTVSVSAMPGFVRVSSPAPTNSHSQASVLPAGTDDAPSVPGSAPGFPEDLCSAGSSSPENAAITLDEAIDRFANAGLAPPYTIDLPHGMDGFYRARTHPGMGRPARTVVLDARDGHRLHHLS
jgi:uncharacterized iron-regulated membrane protein